MMISDDAVEAAAKSWISRHAQPGSWTLEENLRAALDAAAPYMLNPEPGSAMRQAMELVWDQAIDACQKGPTLMAGSEARKLKDANPYRSQA